MMEAHGITSVLVVDAAKRAGRPGAHRRPDAGQSYLNPPLYA